MPTKKPRKKAAKRRVTKVKKKVFVAAVASGASLAEAYVEAGGSPNGARQSGSRLLSDADVQAEIERRLNERIMSADEIMVRQTEIGRADIADFINDDGSANLGGALRSGKGRLLKAVEFTEATAKVGQKVRIELHSAPEAQRFIARLRGMVKTNPAPPPPPFLPFMQLMQFLPLDVKRSFVKALEEAKAQGIVIDVQPTEVSNGT